MKSKRRKGHTNLFHFYKPEELELFATNEYRRLGTSPGFYWLVEECLRELRIRKRISPNEWLFHLAKTYGFAPDLLKLAARIRDNYRNPESVSGLSLTEAAAGRRGSKGRSKGAGRAKPSRGDRQPKANADPSPNGNGAEHLLASPIARSPEESGRTGEKMIVLPSLGTSQAENRPMLPGDTAGPESERATRDTESTGVSPMSQSRLVPREAITIRLYPGIEQIIERFFAADDPRALMILGRPGIGKDEILQQYMRKYPGLAVDPPLSGLSRPLATYQAGHRRETHSPRRDPRTSPPPGRRGR